MEEYITIKDFKKIQHTDEYEVWDEKKKEWLSFDQTVYSGDTSFPNVLNPKHPVLLITIHNSLTDEYDTWGLVKNYTPKLPNVRYHKCKDEGELFEKFMRFWKADPPDILCGWNSEQFDIPYIINRAKKLFSEEFINQLSPVGNLYYRETHNRFGQDSGRWIIGGISCLDYLDVYKAFSKGSRESYSLNYIAEYELDEGKLAFNAVGLAALADNDWDTFVDYNIQDVTLLKRLDDKLKYLSIVRLLAYKGCTNFEAALGKVSIVTGAMALQANKMGLVIPTFKTEHDVETFAGGYVREPEKGIKDSIVSFDVNSLYPNTIITLNISAETKMGKIVTGDIDKDDEIQIKLVNGKLATVKVKNFKTFIKNENISVSKAGVLYTQKYKGVCPLLIDGLYKERIAVRNKMNDLKKTKKKDEETLSQITRLDNMQQAVKVFLNSIYGTLANKHSPFVDIDSASSVTLTGQAVAKQGAIIIDNFAKEKWGVEESLTLASDTDSCYITIQPILDKLGIKLVDEQGVVTAEAHKIVNAIGKIVNTGVIEWAKLELNSIDPRFEFKREAIADVGVFTTKKRYILHILDDEGVSTSKFKYVGVELARSTTPKPVKALLKKTIDTALLSKDIKKTNEVFREAYDEFKRMPIEDISFRRAVNNISKFSSGASLTKFVSRTPGHVKAALAHNLLLDKFGIKNKYEVVNSGQKIKWFYAEKNQYGVESVGFISQYPTEFAAIKIDYDKMFGKIVVPPIEAIYDAIGWHIPQIGKETVTDLSDLFS
jgi:DNA polymerase elongation subunit (family B)